MTTAELHELLVAADSAISHLRHRRTWPLDDFETDRLIGRLRKASELEIAVVQRDPGALNRAMREHGRREHYDHLVRDE